MSEELPAQAPNDLLVILRDDLQPWIAARKGTLSIAGDPGEILETLAEAPSSFRVVLSYAGDDDQSGEPEAGIVDAMLEVWLIKAKGLRMKPGAHLLSASPAGSPPFLQLLSDLRSRVRSLVFPTPATYGRLHYLGSKPFPSPELAFELPSTGFKMTFKLTAAVPWEELRGDIGEN